MPPDEDLPEPPESEEDSDSAGVLSPEELDILEDENVYQLDEGRFVIRADDGPDIPFDEEDDIPVEPMENGEEKADEAAALSAEVEEAAVDSDVSADSVTPEPAREGRDLELDKEDLYDLLASYVSTVDARYGFQITAKFGDEVERRVVFTNDVVTAFNSLVAWYAQHAGDDTPVEDVLGILLVEMDLPVRYPTRTLERYLEAHDLDAEDSIGDLLEVVQERGFRFPH